MVALQAIINRWRVDKFCVQCSNSVRVSILYCTFNYAYASEPVARAAFIVFVCTVHTSHWRTSICDEHVLDFSILSPGAISAGCYPWTKHSDIDTNTKWKIMKKKRSCGCNWRIRMMHSSDLVRIAHAINWSQLKTRMMTYMQRPAYCLHRDVDIIHHFLCDLIALIVDGLTARETNSSKWSNYMNKMRSGSCWQLWVRCTLNTEQGARIAQLECLAYRKPVHLNQRSLVHRRNRYFFLRHFTFYIDGWRSHVAIFCFRIRFQCEFRINEITQNDFTENKVERFFIICVVFIDDLQFARPDRFNSASNLWLVFSLSLFLCFLFFHIMIVTCICVHGPWSGENPTANKQATKCATRKNPSKR